MKKRWHSLELAEIADELRTDLSDGLSVREARQRLENEKKIDGGERYSLFVRSEGSGLTKLFSFLYSPTVIILTSVALLTSLFGETAVGLCVLLIDLIGALICGAVKMRSHKRISAMHNFASPAVRVIRSGKRYTTDGRNIVRGDVILLRPGDLLTCDARIASSDGLVVKELFQTEKGIRNREVSKNGSIIYQNTDPVRSPDEQNMLYAGSVVMDGYAVCVAVETGSGVYLSRFVERGELSGTDVRYKGISHVKALLHKALFLSLVGVVFLTLISILTLDEVPLIYNFIMLLSAVSMVSLNFAETVHETSLAACMAGASLMHRDDSGKKRDSVAFIRDVRAIDTLTGVSDLILLGEAALYEGGFRFGEVYTADSVICDFNADDPLTSRLFSYSYTYLKALEQKGIENEFVLDGVAAALSEHIRSSKFDTEAADLIIKSLYYSADESGERGFACAETTMGEYRVALTFDEDVLSLCSVCRCEDGQNVCDLGKVHRGLSFFTKEVTERGGRCIYIISDLEGDAVLEGIVSIYKKPAAELERAKEIYDKFGVAVKIMLLGDIDSETLNVVSFTDGEIAYASELALRGEDICSDPSKYSVYAGFSSNDYSLLIDKMRKEGSTVAVYGVDDRYYDIMTHADIAVSCDILRYSSEKYRESLYDNLPFDGRDSNLRCSQRTRLLSKILVHRTHNGDGGLNSIINALSLSKSAYLSMVQSLMIFIMLMSTLLPLVAMSVITGTYLLDPIQTAAFAIAAAVISVWVFSDSVSKGTDVHFKNGFSGLAMDMLGYKLPGIIARAALSCIFALSIFLLDMFAVFGENAAYTMPVFISILLTVFIEYFIISVDHTQKGEGRRHALLRIILIYTVLLLLCALITLPPLSDILFPNGIGTYEFLLVPVHFILYLLTVLVFRRTEKKRKKR